MQQQNTTTKVDSTQVQWSDFKMALKRSRMIAISAISIAVISAVVTIIVVLAKKPSTPPSKPLSPIVIVPGFTGNRLHATLDKPNPPCPSDLKDTLIWLSPDAEHNNTFGCWMSNIKLFFDPSINRSYSNPGVTVDAPGFGNTETVEMLDVAHTKRYFWAFVETAVREWGYERGKTIRAAPYDSRKAPNEQDQYFSDLKRLIEETFEANSQQRVSLVAHSMGNLYSLYFLHQQTPDWLNKYLTAFYSIGAPWAGITQALLWTISGFLPIPAPSVLKIREVYRSFPATYLLYPSVTAWGLDDVLVTTDQRNYTVFDIEDLFRDLGIWNTTNDLYHTVALPKLIDVHSPPGVETYCLIGTEVPTLASMSYSKGHFPDASPDNVTFESGDEIVPERSAALCKYWQTLPGQSPVHFTALPTVTHGGLISDKRALSLLQQLILSDHNRNKTTTVSSGSAKTR